MVKVGDKIRLLDPDKYGICEIPGTILEVSHLNYASFDIYSSAPAITQGHSTTWCLPFSANGSVWELVKQDPVILGTYIATLPKLCDNVLVGAIQSKPGEHKCTQFKKYVGFTDTFDYCAECDKRKV